MKRLAIQALLIPLFALFSGLVWQSAPAFWHGASTCAEASAYIARAIVVYSSLSSNATAQTNYKNFICGSVQDGDWSNYSAVFLISPDPSVSQISGVPSGGMGALNLVSSSFFIARLTGSHEVVTPIGGSPSPGWSNGLSGDDSYTVNGFDASSDAKFTTNAAHFSIWVNTGGTDNLPLIGSNGTGGFDSQAGGQSALIPRRTTDGTFPNTYMRINNSDLAGDLVSTTPNGVGHYIVTRTSSSSVTGYWNDTSLGSVAQTSAAAPAGRAWVVNNDLWWVDPLTGSQRQFAALTLGGPVTSAAAHRMWLRMSAYMTAIGNPCGYNPTACPAF